MNTSAKQQGSVLGTMLLYLVYLAAFAFLGTIVIKEQDFLSHDGRSPSDPAADHRGTGKYEASNLVFTDPDPCFHKGAKVDVKFVGFQGSEKRDEKCDQRKAAWLMTADMPDQAMLAKCALPENIKVFGSVEACYFFNNKGSDVKNVISRYDQRYLEQLRRCGKKRGLLGTNFHRDKRIERCMNDVAREQLLRS